MAAWSAVVVAAGRGRRFGGAQNKAFLPVLGAPLAVHSLRLLEALPRIQDVVIVVGAGEEERARVEWVQAHGLRKVRAVVAGGAERQDSVYAGLLCVPREATHVAVHDAARPAASAALWERVLTAAEAHGAAVPAVQPVDTLFTAEDGRLRQGLDRSQLVAVQTPQAFCKAWLLAAHERAREQGMRGTDDASLVQAAGYEVHYVEGDPDNLKVTWPNDVNRIAQGGVAMDLRVGSGYDVHAFAEGRRLVLGGVTIPSDRGLVGHSDADVLVHALMDALLGAAGIADIGTLFPNDDPAYLGADSMLLLAEVMRRIGQAGWRVVNADATILAERPKIAPHVPAMRERLAGCLGVQASQVCIKATTNEGMGFIGRGEGIAALATVLLRQA